MARRVPKLLVHADGMPFCFCQWHPDHNIYALIVCDDDVPPRPEEAKLRNTSIADVAECQWVPFTLEAQPTAEPYRLEPYDDGQ